ncbi:hypothetical protein [Actinomadura sp. KC345]|uniref:hypothetical protein n=1 Tax=Actinomadura sp. KC345 TaxID=2530371 RepID=UPI001404E5A9|nr:hypothetical protein [Actinomadura sp. KC345]
MAAHRSFTTWLWEISSANAPPTIAPPNASVIAPARMEAISGATIVAATTMPTNIFGFFIAPCIADDIAPPACCPACPTKWTIFPTNCLNRLKNPCPDCCPEPLKICWTRLAAFCAIC